MEVRFADKDLDRLETDANYDGGYSHAVVRAFRRRIQQLRDAQDVRDLYAIKSFHFEKLKGKRSHQRSIKLNDQQRLILEVETKPKNVLLLVGIEDYH